jgi:plastocyanin
MSSGSRSRFGISAGVAAIALILLIVSGGASVYYAFATRNAGGPSNSGFTLDLTSTIIQVTVPKGDVEVVIPHGITNSSSVTFEPLNIKVQVGVNNTIFFYNEDNSDIYITSVVWPGSLGFSEQLGPGQYGTVQLNTTGFYAYNFELKPYAALNGTISVVAG